MNRPYAIVKHRRTNYGFNFLNNEVLCTISITSGIKRLLAYNTHASVLLLHTLQQILHYLPNQAHQTHILKIYGFL
jgi:hypothetical protein